MQADRVLGAVRIGVLAAITLVLAGALAACGAVPSAQVSTPLSASLAHGSHRLPVAAGSDAPAASQARSARRLDAAVTVAKATYRAESEGPKLVLELDRIARDPVLLSALRRGDLAGAQAAANAQLRSAVNHLAHVTRISVVRGSRVLVNATVNSDGVFVVTPGTRLLRSRDRVLGTLLVSIQDVTGFVKLVHRLTGAEVVARGGSGRVRASLSAASRVSLPRAGRVTIAGQGYAVRSFGEVAWGGEPLAVWVLVRD